MKKKFALVAVCAVGLRLALLTGAGAAVLDWLEDKAADGRLVSATLNVELGTPAAGEETLPEAAPSPSPTPAPSDAPSGQEEDTESVTDSEGGEEPTVVAATLDGSSVANYTSFEVDPAALLAEGLGLTLPAQGPQVLIVHTHGSEAYTPSGTDRYTESDSYRTEDKNYSVIRVGDELAEALEGFGLSVLHDREIYDYPSYTGSYGRSGAAIESYLAQYPDIAVVIDLHRDALGTGDTVYKTMAVVSGQSSAQVMFVVGTGETGLTHPYWRENLKLALTLQAAMDEKYPTLARPINLARERYNQQYTIGSLLIEVGSSGNTLQEALLAVRLFAEAAGPVLQSLVSAG